MKLYTSVGPNPHVVRMFMAEKGIDLPLVEVDVRGGENRQPAYLARNPHGQTPALELDDGRYLSEITAICEYLEEVKPAPALIGSTPEERAETRMWTRRIDLNICEPLTNGHRYGRGLAMFKGRMIALPEAAEGLKRVAQDRLKWLDGQMAGKTFICGDRFSLADILLYGFLWFGHRVEQPLNPAFANLTAWYARVGARPSASATAW
jgi:glutathione S-transferase